MSRKRGPRVGSAIPPATQPAPSSTPSSKPAWPAHRWKILALAVLTLLAYSNSFQAGLIFDNSKAILEDARVHAATADNVHLIFHEEYWYKTSTTGLYRPLTTLSYLFNYAMLGNGPNPAGYHWVNLLLHLVNISLVYLLGIRIAENANLAFALAALWGVHPLLTESVTNVVGRADLLAGFGVLAGLLCHLAAVSAPGRWRMVWLAGLAGAAAIGIFSKEAAAVLPGVMLLYDVTWGKPAAWRARAPAYAVLALPFAAYFWMRGEILARSPLGMVPFVDNPLTGAGFWTARLTAIGVIGKFLSLFVWPARLSADYSYASIPLFGWRLTDPNDLQTLAALAVCLSATVLAIRWYRRSRPVFFCIVFFFLTLAPTSNVFLSIGSIMAERFLYLPSIGLTGCAVAAIYAVCRRLSPRWPAAQRAAWAVLGLVCVSFAARTYARNPDWYNDRSLWASVVRVCPESAKARSLLASILLNAGPTELDQAAFEAGRSLAIVDSLPDELNSPQPYEVAAKCYRLKGDSLTGAAAMEWYRKAAATLERGVRVDAVSHERIRRLNLAHGKRIGASGTMSLYLELGRAYLRLSEPEKALPPLAYGRAHSSDPEFTIELSHALRAKGDWEQAAIVLVEGLVADAASSRLAGELLELYRQAAPASCAVQVSGGSPSINMECPLVHSQVCAASRNVTLAYRTSGQAARADATARSAVQELGCPAGMFR